MLRHLGLVSVLALGGFACQDPPAVAEPTPPTSQPAPSLEEDLGEEFEDPPEQEAPPSFTTSELDAMERPELEAACYQGSSAACDRLGH